MIETVERGEVLEVWLNRPESLNPLDDDALGELAEIFVGLQRRTDVKVVVLGGRGRAFSAGADLKHPPGFGGDTPRERRWRAQVGFRACQAIADCEAITVARLQGHCYGGGLALMLGCDFRVATEGTLFALPEVALGIPMTWGAVPRLIAEVGAAKAREIVLLCEPFDAREAQRLSLVHRVVAPADLDAGVQELVDRLTSMSEYALHTTKTQFRAYAHPAGDPTFAEADLLRFAAAAWEGRGSAGPAV